MITRSGLGAALASLVLVVCGVWWGYEEFIVVGAVAGVAVAVAVGVARRPIRLEVDRRVASPRVARGAPLRMSYAVANRSRHWSSPVSVVDRFDGAEVRTQVEPIEPGGSVERPAVVPTTRRGVFEIGPTAIERVDPFGLAVGRRDHGVRGAVVVHPRVLALYGPDGTMHTVESEALVRTPASDPLSGFVSLREYVDGDDPRLIHWPTTARMGALMVREHVELRRPEFTVVLDAADWVATADDFEEMVDVAASIAVHALRTGVDVGLRTTSRRHPGATRPLRTDTDVLDLLTPVGQGGNGEHLSLSMVLRSGLDQRSVVFVTGPRGPSGAFGRHDRVTVVRVGAGAAAGPGITLAAEDATTFARRWRPIR